MATDLQQNDQIFQIIFKVRLLNADYFNSNFIYVSILMSSCQRFIVDCWLRE